MSMHTSWRQFTLVAILISGLSARAGEPVLEKPPPRYWDHFVMLVWQHQTDVIKDRLLYESLNLNGFHIDRGNPPLRKFADRTGWLFYVDHAADKGYLHLGEKSQTHPRRRVIVERPVSLVDPLILKTLKGFLKTNIEAARGSKAVGYALDDEVSLGSFCNPCEVDGSPLSVAWYQDRLKEQYRDIVKLNRQYGTSYQNFNQVKPKSYEAFREQLLPDKLGEINLSAWCDWRGAMDTQFAETLAELVRYANTLDPKVPAGIVGGQMPSVWGGYDYRKLCASLQWIEAYDIGGTNEILRSFWNQEHARTQTFFSSKDPKKDAWFLWYYLCHGNRGVIVWPEGWFSNGTVAPYVSANAATFKEVQGRLSRLIVNGEFQHDPVAIYYSHPSIQLGWALDAACHGKTWPNRSSGMDNQISTGALSRNAWLKSLEDIGIQAKFIHQDHLLGGELRSGGFKVLILNAALALSNREAEAIQAFAAGGGTVIADYAPGLFDEHGRARPDGALDRVFGVKHDLSRGILNGKTLTEVDGELGGSLNPTTWNGARAPSFSGLAAYELGLSEGGGKARAQTEGVPVMIRGGRSTYLNLSPIGYLLNRDNDRGRVWRDLLQGLFAEAGIVPRVKVSSEGKPLARAESIFWKNGSKVTLCVLENLDRNAGIDGFGEVKASDQASRIRIRLQFTKPVNELKNERTGRKLGAGSEFEDEFDPWSANVYTFAP